MIILRNSYAFPDFQRSLRTEKMKSPVLTISDLFRPNLITCILSKSSGGLPAHRIKSQIWTVLTRFSTSLLGQLFCFITSHSSSASLCTLAALGPCCSLALGLSFLWAFAVYVPFSCKAYPTKENSCSIFRTHPFPVLSPLGPSFILLGHIIHTFSHPVVVLVDLFASCSTGTPHGKRLSYIPWDP